MPFKPGQSGNPGGRKRSLGLSRAVRKSEGLKSWAWLCKAGAEQVLERKEIKGPDGNSIMVDVVPSVKMLLEVHKLKLAYCWGTPVAIGQDELEQRIIELEQQVVNRGGISR